MADRTFSSGTLRREIAERAYYRYCERGRIDGHDIEDWLVAEREVLQARSNTAAPPSKAHGRRAARKGGHRKTGTKG